MFSILQSFHHLSFLKLCGNKFPRWTPGYPATTLQLYFTKSCVGKWFYCFNSWNVSASIIKWSFEENHRCVFLLQLLLLNYSAVESMALQLGKIKSYRSFLFQELNDLPTDNISECDVSRFDREPRVAKNWNQRFNVENTCKNMVLYKNKTDVNMKCGKRLKKFNFYFNTTFRNARDRKG